MPEKTIWVYTGYTYEKLTDEIGLGFLYIKDILKHVDVLVDGPYIREQRDVSLCWRESANQRVIDVPKLCKQELLYCTARTKRTENRTTY